MTNQPHSTGYAYNSMNLIQVAVATWIGSLAGSGIAFLCGVLAIILVVTVELAQERVTQ
jgi:hypothetical protein